MAIRKISVGTNLTADTKTTVYTVPDGYRAAWNLCHVSNHTGSNKSISMFWYDASANVEIVVLDAYNLDAKKFIEFGGSGLYVLLEEGDQVRLTPEAGSSMSSIATFELERNNA